jgi:predicted component of viral defense system (DUF524 family)
VSASKEVQLHILGDEGHPTGVLIIRLPPHTDFSSYPVPLLDERDEPEPSDEIMPVQLLEGKEYLYEVRVDSTNTSIELTPDEFFYPDDESGRRGRLRPGLHVGMLNVRISAENQTIGEVALEVRSRKLDYLSHYRWMLRDITEGMTELVMQRFAPTEQRFAINEALDAATLYQRFAFLKSLLLDDVFGGAIHYMLRQPYSTWAEEEEVRRPGQGVRATSEVLRQISRPGPRVSMGHLRDNRDLETLPRTFRVSRHEETLDNSPNRFVKFVLERWRDVVAQIYDLLDHREGSGAPVRRGLKETENILDRLDGFLGHQVFREIGRLNRFPAGNQVLQKREGYREIFRAYVQFEAAAQLSWKGGEDVYGAGQRDVSVLFEYWVFYQLGREIAGLCEESFGFDELIEESDGGLHLQLKQGEQQLLSGIIRRLGRELKLEFWFNRSFSSKTDETWIGLLRPDCSLCIRSLDPDESFFYDEVWLHFDAKYRLDRLEQVWANANADKVDDMEEVEEGAGDGPDMFAARAKGDDLLKMHAYRDAIYRSSGAYVIYPGTEEKNCLEYHEILPGLGAFPLRPTEHAKGEGIRGIRQFIDEVVDHVATQASQHERARYWKRESYRDEEVPRSREAAPFLEQPPADTRVLLGYVKSKKHRKWIRREALYNLRADEERAGSVGLESDELSADLLLLYGRSLDMIELWTVQGAPQLYTRERMLSANYPSPKGEQYFCLKLGREVTQRLQVDIRSHQIRELHRRLEHGAPGSPVSLSWRELMVQVSGANNESLE